MTAKAMLITSVRREAGDEDPDVLVLKPGVNVVVGPKDTGKTGWLLTISYLLGDRDTPEKAMGVAGQEKRCRTFSVSPSQVARAGHDAGRAPRPKGPSHPRTRSRTTGLEEGCDGRGHNILLLRAKFFQKKKAATKKRREEKKK